MPIYDSRKGKEKEMFLLGNGWTLARREHDDHARVVIVRMIKKGCADMKFAYPEYAG